jgi:hypothetical protein
MRRENFMSGMAVTSFSGRIAKAGGRFLAEIAVSSIATLCVSLGLSNYLTRESPAALPFSPPAFTRITLPLGEVGAQIGTTTSAIDDWQLITPAGARAEDLSLASLKQAAPGQPASAQAALAQAAPASAAPAQAASADPSPQSSARPQPHQAHTKTHAPKPACSGECAGRPVLAQPAAAPVMAEAQPAQASAERPILWLPGYGDAPLPPLPIPEVAFGRTGLHPIATAANLLTKLAGRW